MVKPGAIHLLTYPEMAEAAAEFKNFTWPPNLKELFKGNEFIAADLMDIEIEIKFKPGVEVYFGGDKAAVELGSDKDCAKEAYVKVKAPQLRAWWDSTTKQISLAFMKVRRKCSSAAACSPPWL